MADKSLSHPPKFDKELSDYDCWKTLTEFWQECTTISPNKQALFVVSHSLPYGSQIQKSILEQLGKDQLNHKEGMARLFKFMDKYYKKNNTLTALDNVSAFYDCKAENFDCVDDYILESNRLYSKLKPVKSMTMGDGD